MEAAIIAFGVAELGALIAWAGWVSTKLNHIDRTIADQNARFELTLAEHDRRLVAIEEFFPRTVYVYPGDPSD